ARIEPQYGLASRSIGQSEREPCALSPLSRGSRRRQTRLRCFTEAKDTLFLPGRIKPPCFKLCIPRVPAARMGGVCVPPRATNGRRQTSDGAILCTQLCWFAGRAADRVGHHFLPDASGSRWPIRPREEAAAKRPQ